MSKGLFEILKDLFGCQVPVEPMTVDPVRPAASRWVPRCRRGFPSGKCEEDHHYHQHYPSCPYTGRCYPDDSTPSPAVPDTPRRRSPTRRAARKRTSGEMRRPEEFHR